MKRNWTALFWVSLLLAWPSQAGAQAPAGSRAQVTATVGAGKAAQFSVPQIELPDEVAARQVNSTITRILAGYAEEPVDSTLTLARQLRQLAAQPCCLRGAKYQVLLNQSFLLSLKLTLEFSGAYYYERTTHLVFDLRTGRRLALTELVADKPIQLRRRLEAAVNRRIGEFLEDTTTRSRREVSQLAERFYWESATRRVRFGAGPSDSTAGPPNIREFALMPNALLLFYRVELPATMLADTPKEAYRFPYAKLQPIGLLKEMNQRPANSIDPK